MISISATERDDSNFVEMVARILGETVRARRPSEVYLVRIDHWFDHKWEAFSGKALGALGVWKEPLTLPPFNPRRVLSEAHYEIGSKGADSYVLKPAPPLHIDQWSDENMRRFVRRFSGDALFVWYSGDTKARDRASLMVYSVEGEETSDWYASFVKKGVWKLNKSVGVSRRELLTLIEPPAPARGVFI